MSLQLLTLISIVVFFTTEAASGEEVVKAVGDEVSFKLDTIVPPVTSITWKHVRDGVTVKAIEWEEGQTTTIPNTRFTGITTLDTETGQITIKNLKVEHSGVYTIDVSGKEQTQRFTLNVMQPVPKPEITVKTDNSGVVNLICKYSETIIWRDSAVKTLTGSEISPQGESITVKKKENPEIFYTCTLQNAVSEETSDPVYERDLFKASNKGCVVAAVIPSVTMVITIILFLS
ncbi:hypothetical protein R3I93_006531 [Phoxinus phoxinus]|uniref:Immunoglobulin domain-containing protein n=1 Tax=Phoxinus phoxinus TaxID=58324 RepID=A0AAN9HCB6_9TELE